MEPKRKPGSLAGGTANRRLVVGVWLGALILAALLLLALAAPLPAGHAPMATVLYDCRGNHLATLCAENRQPVTLAEVPTFFQQAVIAIEDSTFYRHGGISLRGIARALWRNLSKGQVTEGGSTITQQLARMLYLSLRRTVWRKLAEVFYAFKLELRLSKAEILTGYLNQIYFGEGAYGIKAAAWAYFSRSPQELNRAEQALLAGIIRSPGAYSPWRHPEAARERLATVLQRMRTCGYIEEDDVAAILRLPLRLRKPEAARPLAPYFVSHVREFLAELLPDGVAGVYRAGLRVETTLDPEWQAAAETALSRLDSLGAEGPEGCLVALDPKTGAIRALVGGRDFQRSQFNRITQARRQPGSAFKPIVYACALERGYTLAAMRDWRPRLFQAGGESYLPSDSGKNFGGEQLSLRDALAASCNVVAVSLGSELGPAEVADFAGRLGIESSLKPYLSLPLGTSEVRPLELAAAYAAFANGGLRVIPFSVVTVRSADGQVLYRAHPEPVRVIRESTAFLLTQALGDVFGPRGTAAGVDPGRPAAGKTGTSDGNRDAWFAGYTPDVAAVVQIGYDTGHRPLPGSGGSLAAPIWADFLRRALRDRPAAGFAVPADVRSILICKDTGALAGPRCPGGMEYFAAGTEPNHLCERHRVFQLHVCKRSGLLPGPYCRELTAKYLLPEEEPHQICQSCRGGFLDWLEQLFRRSPVPPRSPGRLEEPGSRRKKPTGERRALPPAVVF